MKTIHDQTGWRRQHPQMICQEMDVLLAVTEYTYDILNLAFVQYFKYRTGCDLHSITHPAGYAHFFAADSSVDDKSMLITKGKLQDCWELFTKIERGNT